MKWILSLVLCLSVFTLYAQNEEQEYATIYFTARTNMGFPVAIKFFLNDQDMGVLNGETMEYKIYSTGRITVTSVITNFRKFGTIDVEHGKTYYFELNDCIILYENKGKRVVNASSQIFKKEEDLTNPINPESVEAIKKGPGQGTCFLVDSSGLFVTNFHVIEGTEKVFISGMYGDYSSQIAADVIAIDVDNDFALLKLKNPNFKFDAPPYTLANDVAATGTGSFVLGYPKTNTMGSEAKLTDGLISAKSGFRGSISQYQFSAPIQPGNSGSPLLSNKGEILGVATAIHKDTEGVAYAIKSQYLSTFLKLSGHPFTGTTNKLSDLDLAKQTEILKNFIFIVKTE